MTTPKAFQFPTVKDAETFVIKLIALRPSCSPRQHGDRVICREPFAIQMAKRVATMLPDSEVYQIEAATNMK